MGVNKIDTKKVNEKLVDLLEEALSLAKSGDIHSAAIACVWHDNTTSNAFSVIWRTITLLGELRILEHEVIQCHVDTRCHEAGVVQ